MRSIRAQKASILDNAVGLVEINTSLSYNLDATEEIRNKVDESVEKQTLLEQRLFKMECVLLKLTKHLCPEALEGQEDIDLIPAPVVGHSLVT